MERRGFLKLLGLGSAGLVLDPERLLWVPGSRRVFDLGAAPAGIELVGGNTLVTAEWIAMEALRVLESKLRVIAHVNRTYAEEWRVSAWD